MISLNDVNLEDILMDRKWFMVAHEVTEMIEQILNVTKIMWL